MEAYFIYLLKSSVWLGAFVAVYYLFLRNERFFLPNRIFLLFGALATLLFPFFTFSYSVVAPVISSEVLDISNSAQIIDKSYSINYKSFAVMIFYILGALYILLRVARQTWRVVGVIRQSLVVRNGNIKIIKCAEYPASFSFFSFVFINPSTSNAETIEDFNHEREHIRQLHWFDLVLVEVICILLWFNPLAWLYCRFVRQNHEYLADESALQRTANPAIYRAALLTS